MPDNEQRIAILNQQNPESLHQGVGVRQMPKLNSKKFGPNKINQSQSQNNTQDQSPPEQSKPH